MIAPRVADTDALLTVSAEVGFLERKMKSMHQIQSWSSLVYVKSRLNLLGYPKSVSWFQYPHFIKLMWLSIRHFSADTTVEKN